MQRKFIVFAVAAALLCNVLAVGAQERERQIVVAPPGGPEVFIAQGPGAATPPQVEVRGDNLIFVSTEMSFAGKVVKGVPYSAQAVTETVQTLADGNRIVRKNTAQVYRDSEGRTRREQTLGYIGPFATSGDAAQTVFINDPVAGANYILDPTTKTARKLPRVEMRVRNNEGAAGQQVQRQPPPGAQPKIEIEHSYVFQTRVPGPDAPPPPAEAGGPVDLHFASTCSKAETKTEKLDARSFDGVQAEGTRITTTIPAGEIGNEQPIQIVDERWYSPELQVVVMTRHSDPRSGETVYRLTSITRAEPSSALFQVPSDYNVRDFSMPIAPGVRRMRRPAPPPPQEN